MQNRVSISLGPLPGVHNEAAVTLAYVIGENTDLSQCGRRGFCGRSSINVYIIKFMTEQHKMYE